MAPARRGGQASWRSARSGKKRIAGVEVPGDSDLECDRYPPSKLFPDYKTTPPKPLSAVEKIQVARFLTLRSNIHEGPFYTVLGGDNVRVGKSGPGGGSSLASASFDPFEGMPTYSQKYLKRRRRIPKLDSRPYVLRFFPKELWSTLDPKSATTTEAGPSSQKKQLRLLRDKRADALGNLDREIASGREDAERAEQNANENDEDGEGLAENQEDEEEEEEEEEEEVDDEFEEDGSASDLDDYNAEKYFDDGGDDAGGDYDGGGGGGGGEGDGGDYF